MKTNYTKGTWIGENGQVYIEETNQIIAIIPNYHRNNDEIYANQSLIQTAPEMLQTLLELKLLIGRCWTGFKPADKELSKWRELASDVIEKANFIVK